MKTRDPRKSAWWQYLIAVALVAASIGLDLVLRPFLETSHFFLSLFAVTVAALWGGRGPGLLATFLSAIALNHFFLERKESIPYEMVPALVRLALFLGSALFLTWLGSSTKYALILAREEREKAERASRLRDDLVATVSHDLKNPLTAINLKAQLLTRMMSDAGTQDPKARENLESIREISEFMRRLIDSLLDLSKIEAGRFTVETEPYEIGKILNRARDSFELIAQDKAIELKIARVDAETDSIRILCDPDRMLQVISNLVGNAVKFTAIGGTVTLSCEIRESEAVISVSDTGPGIHPEHLPHVFDRYWQAEATARKGTGLGLAISKGIVDAHGGRIWVESRMGEGSTFYVAIPRVLSS